MDYSDIYNFISSVGGVTNIEKNTFYIMTKQIILVLLKSQMMGLMLMNTNFLF